MICLRPTPSYVPRYPGLRLCRFPAGFDRIRDWLAEVPLSDAQWRNAVLFHARRLRLFVRHRFPLFEELPRGIKALDTGDPLATADAIEGIGGAVGACDEIVEDRGETREKRRVFLTASYAGRAVLHALSLDADRKAAASYAAVAVVSGAMVQAEVMRERGMAGPAARLTAIREIPRAVTLFEQPEGWHDAYLTPTVLNLGRVMYRDESWALASAAAEALRDAGFRTDWVLRFLSDPRQSVNYDRSLWIMRKLAGLPVDAAVAADAGAAATPPRPTPPIPQRRRRVGRRRL